MYKATAIKLSVFKADSLKARREWHDIAKQKNTKPPKLLTKNKYPAKLHSESDK